MDKRQMERQNAWNEKAGYISKSYKLKRDLVEEFARTCDNMGVSQASQLTKMMREFIDAQKAM